MPEYPPCMKTARYKQNDGSVRVVEYDENAPCIFCDKPVIEASVGGTVVCPWCDMGIDRDTNEQLTWHQQQEHKRNYDRRMAESDWHKAKGFFWKPVQV